MKIFQQLSPPSRDPVSSTKRKLRATAVGIAISTAITASSNRLKGGEVLALGSLDLRDQNIKD